MWKAELGLAILISGVGGRDDVFWRRFSFDCPARHLDEGAEIIGV